MRLFISLKFVEGDFINMNIMPTLTYILYFIKIRSLSQPVSTYLIKIVLFLVASKFPQFIMLFFTIKLFLSPHYHSLKQFLEAQILELLEHV